VRQRLRLITRATVVHNVNAPSPHYPPAVSCSLRTSPTMPTLIAQSSTEHATASGEGVATRPDAALLLCPHGTAPAKQVRAVPLTPRCSRNLLRSQVPRQRPMRNAAMRRVQFVVPCRRERRPRRHPHRVNACRRLGAGSARRLTGFRGVEHPAEPAGKLDLFLSSTRSPQPLPAAPKTGLRPASESCGLPDSAKPREDGRPHRTALSTHTGGSSFFTLQKGRIALLPSRLITISR